MQPPQPGYEPRPAGQQPSTLATRPPRRGCSTIKAREYCIVFSPLDDSGGIVASFYASCLHEPGNASFHVQEFISWKESLRLWWPDAPPTGENLPHPLDVLLDLAISWNINVLFKVQVYATTDRSSAQTLLAMSMGEMDVPWQERREQRAGSNSYEDYVNDYLDLLGVSVLDGSTYRKLYDAEKWLLRVLLAGVSGTQS
ncbi:hypothetical protein HPB51_011420 [Rhipicephalus microplus]|uniref:Uncharacterized protein n=1 Tax=Rhipicephalus microplus TaxID=6941 RepID=A0A9J6F3A0_RHIMP|nr:hypothetical protein HPB51_011420 [Rhipicephalus microplus]